MSTARSHGWWPYLGPYGLFLILVEIQGRVPEAVEPWIFVLRVLLPGLWILWFVRHGALQELRGYRPGAAGLASDVLCGVVIAALWMGPFLLFPSLSRPDPSEGFDATLFGPGREWLALGVRLFGFALVTPFVEELFVRSFLIRLADVYDRGMDFLKVPIAQFTWRSFLVTVFWFTFTHVSWEWGVAAVAGVIFNLWLYRRGHLGAVIVAHAAANASLWLAVVFGPESIRMFL